MADTPTNMVQDAPIDPRLFRDVLGHYPTGVVVVTGISPEGGPLGMVVGTFASVSLEPSVVSFMPTRNSETYKALRESPTLCMNVLAHDQQFETRTLAQRDPAKFDKIRWTMSEHGVPKLADAVAHIHCTITDEIEAGDHLIVLCSVRDVQVSRPVTPLLFFQGGYGGFSATASAAHVDSALISAVRLAEVARPQLTALAERFDCEAVALVQINDHDQTVGAAARTPAVQTHERLGVRMPLIPPSGEVSVAWSEVQSEKWIARLSPPDPELQSLYRTRLAKLRDLGYTVHVVPEGRDDQRQLLSDALHEYALGELTPARDRAVRSAIAQTDDFFLVEPLALDDVVRVVSVTVPVFDPTASRPTNSGLALRLRPLHEVNTGAQVHDYATALQQAAAEVTRSLAAQGADELKRYQSAGLRSQE